MFDQAQKVIRENRRAYIAFNVVFYALVVCGMAVALAVPTLQERLLAQTRQGLSQGLMKFVRDAYLGGHVARAMALTFVANAVLGALAFITLPSLMIPFAGVLSGLYRACAWGLLMAPGSPNMRMAMAAHWLTLVLEGQAYILAMLGAYLLGKWTVRSRVSGFASAWQGYRAGVRANLALYPLILSVLVVAAVYEAIEVTSIHRMLMPH